MEHKGTFFYGMKLFSGQFKTKAQFNKRINYIRAAINPKQHAILDVMAKHAIKYLGVCGMHNKTIAKKAGTTTRSVQRFTAKMQLEGYGFKVENMRPLSGGNSANYFVFNPINIVACIIPNVVSNDTPPPSPRIARETPTEASDNERKTEEETSSLEANKKLKDLNERKERINVSNAANMLDESFSRNDIPSDFVAAVAIRDRTATAVSTAWEKVKLAFRKSCLAIDGYLLNDILSDQETYQDLLRRLRSAIRADKQGEIRKDFYALLYGTAKQLFDETSLKLSASERRTAYYSANTKLVFYNWLEDMQQNSYQRQPVAESILSYDYIS